MTVGSEPRPSSTKCHSPAFAFLKTILADSAWSSEDARKMILIGNACAPTVINQMSQRKCAKQSLRMSCN